MDGRPLDVLEAAVEDDVTVRLKGGELLSGTLVGYDQHMNLVLGAPTVDPGESAANAVDNTTVIRGDNVVTIET